MTPVLCLVTDRQRLGTAWARELVNQVRSAARAGVHLVQIRERDVDAAALARIVADCVDAVRGTPTRILVNDRVDVALAAGAHGVHLRGDSFPASRVRRSVARPFLIGRSVHSVDEAAAATHDGGADYLIFGTVFETRSKPGQPPAGLAAFAAAAAAASPLPVLAIGGMTTERIPDVMAAGGCGVAGISMFGGMPVNSSLAV